MTHKKPANNLSLALVFIFVVLFFASVSIFFKIFFLVKDSSFDADHNFNLEVKDATNINLISFSPKDKTIFVLEVDPKVKTNNAGQFFKLAIDARVNLYDDEFENNHIGRMLIKSSFSFSKKLENMTILDAFRLALFSRTVSGGSLEVKKLSENLANGNDYSLIESGFKDKLIDKEQKTIEIINATDTFGLGSRLATLVTNIGGDVILVGTKEKTSKSKIIYAGQESYTVKRLSKYLNIKSEKTKKESVADVIIVIGEDILENIKF